MDVPADVPQSELPHSSLPRTGALTAHDEQVKTKIVNFDGVLRAGDTCHVGEVKQSRTEAQSAIQPTEG